MDLECILRPLSGAFSCGEDMSFSPEFDAITEARRFDDPLLGQGEWVTPIKEADWPAVVSLCSSLLEMRSKDLRLAVWLVEGLARTEGIGGLAKGYDLLSRLCELFWDDVHPLAEEGEFSLRAGCLRWLLSQSPRIIRELPLAVADDVREALDRAGAFEAVLRRTPQQRLPLLIDVVPLCDALDETTRVNLATIFHDDLKHSRQALLSLEALQRVLESRLGDDGPGFETTRTALEDLVRTLEPHVLHTGAAAGGAEKDMAHKCAEAASQAPRIEDVPLEAVHHVRAASGITDRATALAQLRAVAAYFRRTEPHSPVAYLADKAAHWGDMSLHQWLAAVVKDGSVLAGIEEALGVGTDERRHGSSG